MLEPVTGSEYDIAPGHWRQTVATGDARSITYLDAFWRPVLSRKFDAANAAATAKMTLRQFDHNGSATFESYPQRNIGSVNSAPSGTTMVVDALGRNTQVRADCELGLLTTATAIKELARDLGRQNKPESVVVKSGQRTKGANAGKISKDIT